MTFSLHSQMGTPEQGMDLHHDRIPVKTLERFLIHSHTIITAIENNLGKASLEEIPEAEITWTVLTTLYDFAEKELKSHPLHKDMVLKHRVLKPYIEGDGQKSVPVAYRKSLGDRAKNLALEIKNADQGLNNDIIKMKITFITYRFVMDIMDEHFDMPSFKKVPLEKISRIINTIHQHQTLLEQDSVAKNMCDVLLHICDKRLLEK